MHRKVVPKGKVLKYYFFTAAFVIAVLVAFPTLLRGTRFVWSRHGTPQARNY